jgi:ankyrin repeat protein
MVDKVYSLLAFSSDAYNEPELRPDYTISADVLAQKIVRFAIPNSVIMQPAEAKSNLVTFEIDGFILGTVKEKWSQKENMRSWIFDANKTTGNIGPVDTEINHLVAQLFEDSWQIDLLSERKLHLDDIICLLRGVSRPSVLRFKDGQYSVVMLATPEPSRRRHEVGIVGGGYRIEVRDPASFLAKIPKPTSSQKSWAEILSILASKSGGRQNFTLSWDPFREPTSDEVSTFQPTVNHPDIQWEARLESIYDTAKNETEKTGKPPLASHDCKSISMLRMMYNSADKEIKAGTSERTITLHTATRENWLGTVKLLLEANAEVDDRDEDGATALCYAAAANHPKIVDALLKAKAEVDRRSPSDLGQTPLDLAASKGYAEVCKLLLDGGASPNPTKANESSYLFDPAVKGFVDTVKVLLKAGANPNATETIGPEVDVRALLLAAETGHFEIVRALLDAGAEVDAVTSTATRALHQAAMNGHTDIVKLLLAAGADVNAQNVDGVTPLDFAVFRQNFETAEEIADAGGIQVKTLPSDEDEDDRVADDGQWQRPSCGCNIL